MERTVETCLISSIFIFNMSYSKVDPVLHKGRTLNPQKALLQLTAHLWGAGDISGNPLYNKGCNFMSYWGKAAANHHWGSWIKSRPENSFVVGLKRKRVGTDFYALGGISSPLVRSNGLTAVQVVFALPSVWHLKVRCLTRLLQHPLF